MISQIAPPDKNVERALQELYKKMNEIINAVNQGSVKASSQTKNETIRRVKNNDGTYRIEFKVQDGWVESTNTTASGFKLRES